MVRRVTTLRGVDMRRRLLIATVTIAALGFGARALIAAPSGSAVSMSPLTVILTRQAAFEMQGGVATGMKDAVDRKADVKKYADSAKALADYAAIIPSLFPPGTETGGDTHALPKIWSDRAGFEKAAADYGAAAKTLGAKASAGDAEGFATAFQAMGKTCGACHRAYRAKYD
jgi:cytochrome c556